MSTPIVERFETQAATQRLMSPARMLSHNLTIVLQTLIELGPLSQSDLSRALACSKSTISSSIAHLREVGLVVEAGSGNPKTGRKSTLLKFNPRACFFLAVGLRWRRIDLAVVDMAGRVHHRLSYPWTESDPESLVETIRAGMPRLEEEAGIRPEKIEGIGIMVPGIVDTHLGVVRFSSVLGWEEEVPLLRLLGDTLHTPMTIYNDANALALGELWIGNAKGHSHMAYIYTMGGLGGACLYNGEMILGHDSAAGEFGKMLVTSDRHPQRAESFLSLPHMLSRYRSSGPGSMDYGQAVAEAIELLREGDDPDAARRMLDELVDKMAQLIVNIVVVFDPQIVVVNCSYLPDPDAYLSLLRRRVTDYLPTKPLRSAEIVLSSLDETTEVVGAAAAAISRSRFHFVVQGRG